MLDRNTIILFLHRNTIILFLHSINVQNIAQINQLFFHPDQQTEIRPVLQNDPSRCSPKCSWKNKRGKP